MELDNDVRELDQSVEVGFDSAVPASDSQAASGLSWFNAQIAPALLSAAKLAERIGKLKSVAKQSDAINPMELTKQLADLQRFCTELATQVDGLQADVSMFRMVNAEADRAEWTTIFVDACGALGHLVEGEYPLFHIFPIEVKTDFANHSVQLNNRTVRQLHPRAVAELVDLEIARLHKERFNATQFMRALVRAYDALQAERSSATRHASAGLGPVLLKQIHALLAIRTGTTSSGYPQNQFAFDLYRLRSQTELRLVLDGRKLIFAETKNARDTIVIVLPSGRKEHLGSLELADVTNDVGETL